MRHSVATIDSPEFINVSSISPLISKCEIKVLYVGENRNRSSISKEVATEMAKTLPGTPIVGYYKKDKEDFGDHGEQVVIDDEGVKFNSLTKPYGFVAPDSKIWFQKFEDIDDFGNSVVREYLMTEGYLWTGQFEEAKRVIEQGNNQSMELDEKTLQGNWSTDYNKGIDFFIINDAVFSKLCILGEDVEPCFEGASVTKPNVSAAFTLEHTEDCIKSLYAMMKELKFALIKEQTGGEVMQEEEILTASQDNTVESETVEIDKSSEEYSLTQYDGDGEGEGDASTDTDSSDESESDDTPEGEAGAGVDASGTEDTPAAGEDADEDSGEIEPDDEDDIPSKKTIIDFKKTDEEEEKNSEEPSDNEDEDEKKKEEEFSCFKKKYELLEERCAELEKQNAELLAFKAKVEEAEKDKLIESFYMLSEEDKAEVIKNKAIYSLDDIEAKLSIICVRKKVSFSLEEENEIENDVPTTFNLNSIAEADASLPAWLKAVEARKQN